MGITALKAGLLKSLNGGHTHIKGGAIHFEIIVTEVSKVIHVGFIIDMGADIRGSLEDGAGGSMEKLGGAGHVQTVHCGREHFMKLHGVKPGGKGGSTGRKR